MAVSDLFDMFTESTTASQFHWVIIFKLLIQLNMNLQVDRKWMAAFFNKFYGKMWLGFCLNTRKHFFVEVFLKKKPAERSYVALKSGTRDFEIALRLRDRQAFKWQLPEVRSTARKRTRANKGWEGSKLGNLERTYFLNVPKPFIKNWSTAFSWEY